ncbi:hypothetical protein QYF61_003288 [Mycteria americana]|uniref:Reverse transcriptase domain-containing protein n=1 Tax=Mycteria americana TaxID=33587 RepID=A0AAN7NQX5_MYCAM|nr:hypothetical protein QYF61_003288 [Mycteria americana]
MATLDVKDMFFMIPLTEDDKPQFAFTWEGTQYTFNRLPQGYKHSPTIAHNALAKILDTGSAIGRLPISGSPPPEGVAQKATIWKWYAYLEGVSQLVPLREGLVKVSKLQQPVNLDLVLLGQPYKPSLIKEVPKLTTDSDTGGVWFTDASACQENDGVDSHHCPDPPGNWKQHQTLKMSKAWMTIITGNMLCRLQSPAARAESSEKHSDKLILCARSHSNIGSRGLGTS